MKNVYNFQVYSPVWFRAFLARPFKNNRWYAVLTVCCLPFMAHASPDFSIFYDGSSIQLSDQMGGNDVITVTQVGGDIQFDVPGRTYAINGGLTFNFPVSIPLAGVDDLVIFGGEGNDVINIGAFVTALPDLNIGGGAGDDVVNFGGSITFIPDASLDVNLQDDDNIIGTDRIVIASGTNLHISGTGSAVFKASQSITVFSGASVETEDGNLTVEANLQAAPSVGNFQGVRLLGGLLSVTGDGYLTVKGKGGNNAAGFQMGVSITSSAKISGGDIHAVLVQGWGGPSSGARNYGVGVESISEISSLGGSVTVIGNGGGTGPSTFSPGVWVLSGSLVTAGGDGDVTVTGTGCTACDGINHSGIVVGTSNTRITSTNGNVTVSGFGGGTAISGSNFGVDVSAGGFIFAGGAGNVKVTGTAGIGSGGSLKGVSVAAGTAITAQGTGAVTVKGTGRESTGNFNIGVANSGLISSTNADVSVTGFAGGKGVSSSNYGVLIQNVGGMPAAISANGNGKAKVVGNGAYDASGNFNHGVLVSGNLAFIDSDNGNVEVIGTGGGSGASGSNVGVKLELQALIFAGGSGTVSVQGLGGKGTGIGNIGVSVESASLINSGGGNVTVLGTGTGTGISGQNHGVQVTSNVANYSSIQAGTNGNVSVRGTAGNGVTGADNYGVMVTTNGQIISVNGNLEVIGQGGGQAPASNGVGVVVRISGRIVASGAGIVTIKGTGGTGVGPSNIGVLLQNTSLVSSVNGKITITGIEGTSSMSNGIKMTETALISSAANIELIANSILIGTSASITNNANNSVTLRQWTNGVAINLGPSIDPVGGPLNLSDTELDRITTGKLVIGNNVSGAITVSSPITRPSQTDMTLITAGAINLDVSSINTAGGLLTFQAAQGVNPKATGVDVQVGTVAFSSGTALNIQINGIIPDVGYSQLNVVGIVNLTGSKLTLSGSFIQPQCAPVVLIKNDGADAVIGTFQGLPEGFVFVNYLGSGKNVSISYVGGDGNDVVLIERVVPIVTCPANFVKPNDYGVCGRVIGFLGTPLVTENCSYSYVNDAPAGGLFDIGVTVVTWLITDINGNSASCTQTVTINDTEFPAFVCPANIEVLNQEDMDCGAVVDFVVTATDNCPGVLLEQNYFSGDVFEMGFNYVVATATDASGNITECKFRVLVNPRPEICNGIDDDCDGYTDELQDWEIKNKLFATDPDNSNQYGQSVDMKGDWAIVGSNQKNAAGEQRGTAYILHRDATSGDWSQALQLFPDNTALADLFFGAKVAMGNGFCAVSARLDDENGVDAGAVYLFKYNGPNPGDWVFYQKILGTIAGEQIGSSLDYYNELLLVGATQNADVAAEAGAAYLYAQAPVGNGNWNLVKKLAAPDSDLGDHFGYDVAISGNHAVVTAKDDDEQGVDAGAAYVFGKDQGGANNWGLIKKIMASDGEDDDNFGVSVDLDGAWAVIGAHKDDDKGPESGSAYIFYQNHGGVNNWGRHTKLTDYNGAKGEQYGYDVSIDGEYIAIGARWERVFQSRAGAVFVYHKEDTGWAEFSRLTDPANLYNDQLGTSVVLDNFSILVGIPGEDLPQFIADCGAVLVFNGVCGDQRPSRMRTENEQLEAQELTVRCYPVPFNQTLSIQIESPKGEIVQVNVFDFMGREVAMLFNDTMEGGRSIQWDASNLPSGNYFVRVSTAEKSLTQSVIHMK